MKRALMIPDEPVALLPTATRRSRLTAQFDILEEQNLVLRRGVETEPGEHLKDQIGYGHWCASRGLGYGRAEELDRVGDSLRAGVEGLLQGGPHADRLLLAARTAQQGERVRHE